MAQQVQVPVMKSVVCILGTLLDLEKESTIGAPRTALMLPLETIGVDYQTYLRIEDTLVKVGYVTISNNCMKLTILGREAAKKINTELAGTRKQVN